MREPDIWTLRLELANLISENSDDEHDGEFLQFAVITGCLHIAKEIIFTGTNNFATYSVLDDGFSRYFGFTDNEVNAILTAAVRTDGKDVIKQWYDGYLFGKNHLYCPWDVINYLSELKKDKDLAPKNYWKNHSSEDNLWSVLLMTGYITKAETDENSSAVTLKIPNKEISSIFQDTVVQFFEETANIFG